MQNAKERALGFFRRLKVRPRLFLFLAVLLALSTAVTMGVAGRFSESIANNYIYGYLRSEHQRVANSIDLFLEEIAMISLRFKLSGDIYEIVDSVRSHDQKTAALQATAATLLPANMNSIDNIYLIDDDGQCYPLLLSDETLPDPEQSFLDKLGNSPYTQIGEGVQGSGSFVLPLGMQCRNFYTGQSAGFLVFYLSERPLYEMYEGLLTTEGFSFLVDNENTVLSHAHPALNGTVTDTVPAMPPAESTSIDETEYQGERALIITTSLSGSSYRIGFPWRFVSIVPYSEPFQILTRVRFLLLAAVSVMMVAAIAVSAILSNRLTKPLRRLQTSIGQLGEGQLDSFVDRGPSDELWELEQGYNDMVVRIGDLIAKNKEEQEQKRKMELVALQAQINPHFLYNTLDAIGWIAKLKDQDEIEQLVMELSRFFRLSLHKGDRWISLSDEVGITAAYVAIEQLRNPGRFDVEYHISEEIADVEVLKLILQPVVENAIKHGITQVRRRGLLKISAWHQGDNIFFEVADNGAGFDTANPRKTERVSGSGYGLKNVQERIELEYGEGCGLSIESVVGEGTTVRITIRFPDPPPIP
ncbi:MAG: sensor histidine kinase [Oscillospiraceae bacterium]